VSGRFSRADIDDVDQLASLPSERLRELWRDIIGRAAPPKQRRVLIRELAWRIQERRSSEGGLDPETLRMLNAAIRALAVKAPSESPSSNVAATVRAVPPPTRHRAASLPTTSRLVRMYRGTAHEVTVDADCAFIYRGQPYRSLTAIARLITGAECSGPKFFGLTTTARSREGTTR
jgi:hypothetical protein